MKAAQFDEVSVQIARCPYCSSELHKYQRTESWGVTRWEMCKNPKCGYRTPRPRFIPFHAPWLIMGAYLASMIIAVIIFSMYGIQAGLLTLAALGAFKIGSAAGRKYYD